jgi:hypothetical protein
MSRADEPDVEATLRLNRKIVQAVIDLKWLVDLKISSRRARPAEISGRLKNEPRDNGVATASPETVLAYVVLATDAWRIQEPPDWDAAQAYAQAAVEMADRTGQPSGASGARR